MGFVPAAMPLFFYGLRYSNLPLMLFIKTTSIGTNSLKSDENFCRRQSRGKDGNNGRTAIEDKPGFCGQITPSVFVPNLIYGGNNAWCYIASSITIESKTSAALSLSFAEKTMVIFSPACELVP